ncbi:MAG TPA: cyclopropane-fatty-acyl-phospholipid synthase family protein [Steroidobacteraceae bacterium]|nr:cyclopropane-fatty-acyl-phospholipid synthase family protein [Steroidobacteraceae bacterium]
MNAVKESLSSSPDRAAAAPAPATGMPAARMEAPKPGAVTSTAGRSVAKLLKMFGNPPFEFQLWNGEIIVPEGRVPVARIIVREPSVLWDVVRDPGVRFGDAYSEGRVEIEGDMVRFMEEVYRGSNRAEKHKSAVTELFGRFLNRPRRVNTLAGSRDNIHHHYDIGNDFYSLWLGRTMAYTCAYYPTAQTTLDEAQDAKMHHVCRKLRLRPGERVVEAGFGWGRLAVHMARHYGVKVRAFNISKEQVAFARDYAKSQGLDSQIEYVEDDYRNISGQFDAFVSVGMLEHVGVEHYRQLGKVAHDVLGANGRGLIHSIGRNFPAELQPWIEKRIFPGAYPPALSQMTEIFEPWDLSVLDVENLRLHYARTLSHWLGLFENNVERVRGMFDEKFVRMWRLYLAGSVAAFTTGTLQLFQVLFATAENNDVPLTRDHLYQT